VADAAGPDVGTDSWLAEQSAAAAVYKGTERYTVDVVISGDRSGDGVTYHVELQPGDRPSFRPGAAPGGASAQLELNRTDANAQARGELHPVVGYMRGTTKTKGATRPLYELFRLLA
jgi:hypothetical protein